jgi:hypothetical protein
MFTLLVTDKEKITIKVIISQVPFCSFSHQKFIQNLSRIALKLTWPRPILCRTKVVISRNYYFPKLLLSSLCCDIKINQHCFRNQLLIMERYNFQQLISPSIWVKSITDLNWIEKLDTSLKIFFVNQNIF